MGWTTYTAYNYKNGKVDRKKECDTLIDDKFFKIIKSRMVGSTYYAAVEDIETKQVFAVICLTSTNINDGSNFGYKIMDESWEPFYYDCPKSILNLLTETTDKNALEWRRKCLEKQNKPKLSDLEVGTIIRFKLGDRVIELQKQAPAFQFKSNWWKYTDRNCYFSKKDIPMDFEIVK